MTYLERAQEIYRKVGEGDLQGAIDQFYDDDVVVTEATGDTFEGKETAKRRATEWQQGIEEFHGGGVNSVTSNENDGVSVVESWVDITPKGGPRMKMEEVAVQQWKDDRIVRERFYYFIPAEAQRGMQNASSGKNSPTD